MNYYTIEGVSWFMDFKYMRIVVLHPAYPVLSIESINPVRGQ